MFHRKDSFSEHIKKAFPSKYYNKKPQVQEEYCIVKLSEGKAATVRKVYINNLF